MSLRHRYYYLLLVNFPLEPSFNKGNGKNNNNGDKGNDKSINALIKSLGNGKGGKKGRGKGNGNLKQMLQNVLKKPGVNDSKEKHHCIAMFKSGTCSRKDCRFSHDFKSFSEEKFGNMKRVAKNFEGFKEMSWAEVQHHLNTCVLVISKKGDKKASESEENNK